MTMRLLASAALLFPLLATADTLVLKNGTRFRGTFNTGNSVQISFTEYNGNRQNIDLADVRELRFGNDGTVENAPPARPFGRNDLPPAGTVLTEDLDRLQADLQGAMDNSRFTDDQRQSLDDSRATLRAASQQSRNGRPVNQRNIRLALDRIRNASTRMSRQDREVLNEDIRRVSASMSGPNNGRDY